MRISIIADVARFSQERCGQSIKHATTQTFGAFWERLRVSCHLDVSGEPQWGAERLCTAEQPSRRKHDEGTMIRVDSF